MDYELGADINLTHFTGEKFAGLLLKPRENLPSNSFFAPDRQRILLLTKSQIIESVRNPANATSVLVREIHPLTGLSSIKFNRSHNGIIAFYFKSGRILNYKVKDASQCADRITELMAAVGMQGKHVQRKMKSIKECLESAEELLEKAKDIEEEFSRKPSIELIQELLDGLREVVERFGAVGDKRYSLVITHIQTFLNKPNVIEVLERISTTNENKVSINPKSECDLMSNPSNTDCVIHHTNDTSTIDSAGDIANISSHFLNTGSIYHGIDNATLKIEVSGKDNVQGTPMKWNILESDDDDSEFEDTYQDSPPHASCRKRLTRLDHGKSQEDLDELSNMLCDITNEFHDMISSFGDYKSTVDENSISIDELEKYLGSNSNLA